VRASQGRYLVLEKWRMAKFWGFGTQGDFENSGYFGKLGQWRPVRRVAALTGRLHNIDRASTAIHPSDTEARRNRHQLSTADLAGLVSFQVRSESFCSSAVVQ